MTRERAEELLAEKDMWLERDWPDDLLARKTLDSVVYRRQPGAIHERVEVARAKHWREAVSDALGIPAF